MHFTVLLLHLLVIGLGASRVRSTLVQRRYQPLTIESGFAKAKRVRKYRVSMEIFLEDTVRHCSLQGLELLWLLARSDI